MKKGLCSVLSLLVFVGCGILCPLQTKAAVDGIVIDGQFTDWSGMEKQKVEKQNPGFEEVSLVYDDTYAYLYVAESPSNPWETRYPTLFFKTGDTVKSIRVNRMDYTGFDGTFPLVISNSWNQALFKADGKVTRVNGKNQWEIAVPLQVLFAVEGQEPSDGPAVCDVSALSVFWNEGGEVEVAGKKLEEQKTPPEESQEPEEPETIEPGLPQGTAGTQEGSKENTEGSGIVIDGYYDDWENVPMTRITYGSWNEGGQLIREYHHAGMVMDDEKLYIMANMCDTYAQQIPLDALCITINGQERMFCIRYENEDGTIDWNPAIYNLAEGIHLNVGVYAVGDARISLGDVAVTITPGRGSDSFEMALDLDRLLAYYDIDRGAVTNGAKIEFYSPNIGPERVTLVGTSTWPYFAVGLCVGVVVLGLSARYGKKKRV